MESQIQSQNGRKSMEWVYNNRKVGEPTLVRKFQLEAWKELFAHCKDEKAIIYELQTRWFSSNVNFIMLETNTIEEIVRVLRDRLHNTNYDLKLVLKPDPTLHAVSEDY